MVRFEDLKIFLAAVDQGSFSAAARELDLTPAAASARRSNGWSRPWTRASSCAPRAA